MAIHEECGVFGILSRKRERLGKLVYYGLYALQHRGQESSFKIRSSGMK